MNWTENSSGSDTAALEAFISRSWFRQLWTVQELVLSAKAIPLSGEDEVDWTDFCRAWLHSSSYPRMLENNVLFLGLHNLDNLRQWLEFHKVGHYMQPSLSEILMQTWYRRATLQHDRVYAVLGLVTMEDYPDLKPDYQLSSEEVFTRVAKSAIETDRNSSLLCLAGYTQDEDLVPSNQISDQVRPSWTPNFGQVYLDICRMSEGRKSSDSHSANLDACLVACFQRQQAAYRREGHR